jgi:hypothetical protein
VSNGVSRGLPCTRPEAILFSAVTVPDLYARSRALLTAGGLGATALAVLAMIWMAIRRPITSPSRRQIELPTRPPEREAPGGELAVAAGLGVVAMVAVAVLAVVGLNAYRVSEPSTAQPGRSTAASRPTPQPNRTKPAPAARRSPPRRLFASTSFWNRPLPAGAAVDAASAGLVAQLGTEVSREMLAGTGPRISTGAGSSTIYEVGPRQRPVRVRLHADEAPMLKRAFAAVPIPRGARPAGGPERYMTIWQRSSDRMWELSGARRRAGGWHADWGGAMRRVSRSRGYYDASAWPGATPHWGATASGLPVAGGMIRVDDFRRGRIDHALAIGVRAPRAGEFTWPAQRTDGTGLITELPQGARLRLDPGLDVGALRLPRLVRMIARAAQQRGLVVRGRSEAGISFFAEHPAPHVRARYRRYLAATAQAEGLAGFPWDRLRVLEMDLCSTTPCRRR